MKQINNVSHERIVDKLWDEMKKEFFKLEVLQYYSVDDSPSLRAWLKGNKEKSIELAKRDFKPWAQGKENIKKIRVHIVEKPLTPYLEWEIEMYKLFNIPIVGEEVYLLDSRDIRGLKPPKGDILIFDQKKIVANHYKNKGGFVSGTLYEDKNEIKPFLQLRKEVLNLPLKKVEP